MGTVLESKLKPETVADGRTRYLANTDSLMLVAIDYRDGPTAEPDPFHSHPHEQIAYVVEGGLY